MLWTIDIYGFMVSDFLTMSTLGTASIVTPTLVGRFRPAALMVGGMALAAGIEPSVTAHRTAGMS